jgi:hypothetical protein
MGRGEFKRAFFAGDLIWLGGVSEIDEGGLLHDLERLQVRPSCVEFTDVEGALCREDLWEGAGVEVIVVRLHLSPHTAQCARLVGFLERMADLQRLHGFRLLLVSGERDPKWCRHLEGLLPVQIEFPFCETEAVLDDAVHRLIELASHHADVQVSRLSEKAAFFLEESVRARVDGELVALVVLGLRRSDGKVLRFRDLLPNFHRHFEGGDQGETV